MALFRSTYREHAFIRQSKDELLSPVQFSGYVFETSDPDEIDFLRGLDEFGRTVYEVEGEKDAKAAKAAAAAEGPVLAEGAFTTAQRGRTK